MVVGALSLLSTLALGWHLLRSRGGWRTLIRSALLYGGGVTLYGIDIKLGFDLMLRHSAVAALTTLTELLLLVCALAVPRAWQLIGGQSFSLHGWLSLLCGPEERLRDRESGH